MLRKVSCCIFSSAGIVSAWVVSLVFHMSSLSICFQECIIYDGRGLPRLNLERFCFSFHATLYWNCFGFFIFPKESKYFVFCMPNSESTNNRILLQKLEMLLLIICSNEDQRLYFQYKEAFKKPLKIWPIIRNVFLLSPALIKDMARSVNSQ